MHWLMFFLLKKLKVAIWVLRTCICPNELFIWTRVLNARARLSLEEIRFVIFVSDWLTRSINKHFLFINFCKYKRKVFRRHVSNAYEVSVRAVRLNWHIFQLTCAWSASVLVSVVVIFLVPLNEAGGRMQEGLLSCRGLAGCRHRSDSLVAVLPLCV